MGYPVSPRTLHPPCTLHPPAERGALSPSSAHRSRAAQRWDTLAGAPLDVAGAPKPGACPLAGHCTHAGCTPRHRPATPLPQGKTCGSVTASSFTGRPVGPTGPDAGERVRAEAATLLGHSLDTGPQDTAHLKRHLEFVTYGDATGRILSRPMHLLY